VNGKPDARGDAAPTLTDAPAIWEVIGRAARAPICVFDRQYRLVAFNQAHNDEFFRVNGYATRVGDVLPDLFLPEQGAVLRKLMARALAGEAFTVVEAFGNPALSHARWEIVYGPLRNAAGEIVGAFHVAQDVCKGLRGEVGREAPPQRTWDMLEQQVADRTKELCENRARLRTIFETSFGFQGLLSKNGIVLDANATSLEAIGQPLAQVVGQPLWETAWVSSTPGMAEAVRAGVAEVAQGQVVRDEVQLNLPIGGWRWFEHCMRPIHDEAGGIAALVTEAVETTARRRAEEALRQSQKMEALGQLTGGIAHDFNNLLAAISGNLELLGSRVAQGHVDGLDRYVDGARDSLRRAAALTERLLAFARRETLDLSLNDVNGLIRGMEEIIRRGVGPAVRVDIQGAVDFWPIRIDRSQLENALLNLCINARDAMGPDGGLITIETSAERLDAQGALELDLIPGDYVLISVIDTGTGMPPEVMAKAFDPFFTTKPRGEGTGLGLSMVYGFARHSRGQARITSDVGQGTRVCLWLPRFDDAAPEMFNFGPASRGPGEGQGESETVLVIDDEPVLRAFVVEMLEACGYRALEAPDARSGLEIVRSEARIDLLIVDVGLPGGMNGVRMAEAARAARPGLGILFTTGFAKTALLDEGPLLPGMAVMTKPFAMNALASKVRALIDQSISAAGA
jgi:PAS domain S-box-containing protein